MKDKITLIIPAYNRPQHLLRAIEYSSKMSYEVIIVDDSLNKPVVPDLPQNVSYFYFEERSFYNKVNFALDKVITPYVMLCADDDFHLPTGIKTGINFLEQNQSYSCVHGISLSFYKLKEALLFNNLYEYGNTINNEEINILPRLKKYFSPFYPNYYSIHKTQNLREVFTYRMRYEILGLIEFMFSFVVGVHGKFKVLPVVFHLREEAAFSAGNTTPLLPDIAINKMFEKQYSDFKQTLSNYYSVKTKTDILQSEKDISEIVNSYLNWVKMSTKYNSKFSYAYIKRKYLKPMFPSIFSKLVELKKRKQFNSNHNQKLIKSLNEKNIKIDEKELEMISNLVLKFKT